MISNCGEDENGRFSGGRDGDQTGREWQIKEWKPGGWTAVLRHPDPAIREELAILAERSAQNDHVGYDQSKRKSFWRELKRVYYDPSAIRTPCATDCSAGTAALVRAAGLRRGEPYLKRVDLNMNTWSEAEELTAAGFLVLREPYYFTTQEHFLRGDILLMEEKHHTAINLSSGSFAKEELLYTEMQQPRPTALPGLLLLRLRWLLWRIRRHF